MTAATIAAQVGGHRLVQRQQLEAAVVDLDVQVVDRLVADEHVLDQRRSRASARPRDGLAHALLGQPAHGEQPLLQRFELFLKVSGDAFHDAVSPSRSGR